MLLLSQPSTYLTIVPVPNPVTNRLKLINFSTVINAIIVSVVISRFSAVIIDLTAIC